MTVLLIDLDRFKPINDLRGHDAGDALLQEVALRLTDVCDEWHHVIRLGGDEFAFGPPESESVRSSVYG